MDHWALKASYSSQVNDPLENIPIEKEWNSEIFRNIALPPFFSFSEKMDMPAMWGHYADNAKGVCLIFIFPISAFETKSGYTACVVHKNLKGNENPADDLFFRDQLLRMKYTTKRAKCLNKNGTTIEKYGELLATKASCWKYEKEMRLVSNCHSGDKCSDGHMLYSLPMRYFAGVLIGPRCSETVPNLKYYIDTSYHKECQRREMLHKDREVNILYAELCSSWVVHKVEYDPVNFRILDPFLKKNGENRLLRSFFSKFTSVDTVYRY